MERRIILVGKTGNGKSSTGNSLLQTNAFPNKKSPNPVTQECIVKMGINSYNGIVYKVADTPGLMDTSKTVGEQALEIYKSIEICPNPHAFLLVFSVNNCMTTDEKFTIDFLRVMFGDRMFEHTIVVFTNGKAFDSEAAFEEFWGENEEYVKLIRLCNYRVLKIENENCVYSKNEGTECIIKFIENMSNEGKTVYNYKQISTHKEVLEQHVKEYNGNGNVHEDLSDIAQRLGKRLDKGSWKVKLFGGILLGAGVIAVGCKAGPAAANAVISSGLGASLINNAAAIGGAVANTATAVATKVRFW